MIARPTNGVNIRDKKKNPQKPITVFLANKPVITHNIMYAIGSMRRLPPGKSPWSNSLRTMSHAVCARASQDIDAPVWTITGLLVGVQNNGKAVRAGANDNNLGIF